MSAALGRVLTGLTRASVTGGGILIHKATSTVSVRPLALSFQRSARLEPSDEEVNKPIKFSTSKASHRTWKVDYSMGSHDQRPWWKVLPLSLFAAAFLLWCALREKTNIDRELDTQLHERLPSLPVQTQSKSD